jgi:endonuclease/exonuclease/phosphatase family metal-dependent hydrolase
MYIATHNIWDTEKAFEIGRAIRRVSSVAGIQEVNEQKETNELEELVRGLGRHWDLVNSFNPIAYDKRYLRLANSRELPNGFQHRGLITLHPAREYKGEFITGARKLSFGIFKFVRREALPPVAFVNFHLQHRAWNGKERNPEILAIRRENWWDGYEMAQWVVLNMLKHGLTTMWMGDYNRRRATTPKFLPRQQYVAGTGIDFIDVAKGRGPKATKFEVHPNREKKIDTPSDHPLIVGNIQFRRP